MLEHAYWQFCEDLWRGWLDRSVELPQTIRDRFLIDHLPEPYLRFGDGTRPFCLLLTNPGFGMPHQERARIQAGQSCVSADCSYYENAARLAEFYLAHLPSGGASTRNTAIQSLRELLGCDHVLQFESLPFHSETLPGKHALPSIIRETPLLEEYTRHLTAILRRTSVLTLSAVASDRPITPDSIRTSPWLAWQARLMGADIDALELHPLATKDDRVTVALLCGRQSNRHAAFVLTMGSSSFPAEDGRERLASILRRSASSGD